MCVGPSLSRCANDSQVSPVSNAANQWLTVSGCYSLASGIWQADAGKRRLQRRSPVDTLLSPSQRDSLSLRRSLALPVYAGPLQ